MENTSQNEEWKQIEFDGMPKGFFLEVSNYGKLRKYKKDGKTYRYLKSSNMKGYQIYAFKFDRSITKLVHRLVAEAFIKKEHEAQEFVIHLDYNKQNNFSENLKWVTKETMFAHQKMNPNYIPVKGKITNAKLTETEVIRLKKKLARGNNKLYK